MYEPSQARVFRSSEKRLEKREWSPHCLGKSETLHGLLRMSCEEGSFGLDKG